MASRGRMLCLPWSSYSSLAHLVVVYPWSISCCIVNMFSWIGVPSSKMPTVRNARSLVTSKRAAERASNLGEKPIECQWTLTQTARLKRASK